LQALSPEPSDQDAATLGRAQVTLKGGEPSRSLSITTGASGAFRFEKLSAGDYEILVTSALVARVSFKQTEEG
jgi:carboxypeptidase family protein